jgi:hypothetical protein
MMRIFVGALLAAAINGPVDPHQRNRATGTVIFYAAPNGSDIDNDCLSAANPCTPQGAHTEAKNNWDFAYSSCWIQLADGTYTGRVSIVGQYVGTHLCDLWHIAMPTAERPRGTRLRSQSVRGDVRASLLLPSS